MSLECEKATRPADGVDRDVVVEVHYNPGEEVQALADLDAAYDRVRAGLVRRMEDGQ